VRHFGDKIDGTNEVLIAFRVARARKVLRDAIFNLQDMLICLNANPGAGINFALISEIARAERKIDEARAALNAIDPPTKDWIEGRVAPSACNISTFAEFDCAMRGASMDSDEVDEGADAYCAAVSRRDCPHPLGTQDRIDWLRGWDEAERIDFEQLAESMIGA